jgi:hypothetical protein
MPEIVKILVKGFTQTLEASVTSSAGVNGGRKIELDYPISKVVGIYDNALGSGTDYWTEYDDERPQAKARSIKHFEKYILLPSGSTLAAETACYVTYEVWSGYLPIYGGYGSTGLVGLAQDVMSVEAGPQAFAVEMSDRNTGTPMKVYISPQAGGMVVKSSKVVTDGADIDMYVYSDPGTAPADTYATGNQDTDQEVGDGTTNAAGQSFAGDDASIRNAVLWLQAVASPTGFATCSIYASTGTDPNRTPTGSAIITSDPVDVETIGATYEAVTFTFNDYFIIESGTTYFVVLEYEGDAVNYLEWGTDTSAAGHASNNFAVYTTSWADEATTDGCFTVNSGKNPTDTDIIYMSISINLLDINNDVWVVDGDLTSVWVGYVDNGSATPASTTIELRGGPLI